MEAKKDLTSERRAGKKSGKGKDGSKLSRWLCQYGSRGGGQWHAENDNLEEGEKGREERQGPRLF